MIQNVTYESDALILRIPTSSPETLHELLMKGLTTSLKNHLLLREININEVDSLVALAEVLKHILPTERQLQKAS